MTLRLIPALILLAAGNSVIGCASSSLAKVTTPLPDVPLTSTTADMAPTNILPNGYQTIEGWAKLPAGRVWGSTSAVYPDKDGVSMWVAERCGTNSCATSDLPSVLLFDASGKLVKSFGAGILASPHGIYVDRDGNVWVTDCTCTNPRPPATPARGHQIFKFSPDGKLLLTLGKVGGGRAPEFFFQPNGLVVAHNGDIFVVEGHGMGGDRVLKFSKTGTLIKTWGKRGTANGDFNQPHAIAIDSRGRLFVGDRGNNRIQIFDQDGNFLAVWYQFGRPSGIFIDASDNIYVADAESGSLNPAHGAWLRGIRIGKAADGSVSALIPDPVSNATGTSAAEGVAVDARGNIYGAEVGPRALKKYVKR